jgi:hypothetical protein
MSRIRSIHPGLWTDEGFVSLSHPARLLYMGLWGECDDFGSFPWSPMNLKIRLLPVDNVDVAALLAEMVAQDRVMRYEVNGKFYGAVRNFCRFQRPRKPQSTYPQTNDVRNYTGFNGGEYGTEPDLFGGKSGKVDSDGEERRGEEGSGDSSSARASAMPADFEPVLTERARALVSQWPDGMYDHEVAKFTDYHTSKGSKFKDWQAAFRTWIGNAQPHRFQQEGGNGRRQRSGNGLLDAVFDAERKDRA